MIRAGTGVERQAHGDAGYSFRSAMADVTRQNSYDKLNQLGDDLTQQGKLVAGRVDILELKRYKEMLAEFMYLAVHHAFEFDKKGSMDHRGRHKVYALIKKINEKLADLTQMVLKGEADRLAVMAAIDDIRGLLLELYM
jgi:hypothetical protein